MLYIQEMFDKAVRGLHKQGWAQALDDGGCVYQAPDGKRCAWGHVDESLTERATGSVGILHYLREGLAAGLDAVPRGLSFATALQRAHDCNDDRLAPDEMVKRLRVVADQYDLSWPEGIPESAADVPKETV